MVFNEEAMFIRLFVSGVTLFAPLIFLLNNLGHDCFGVILNYCDKTRSLALALHFNFLVHTKYDLLIPQYNTKALRFV
jgi:hypothetical protein